MKVLFAASEADPLAKVGGLGDVVGSLPRALGGLGHDVRVVLPAYGSIKVERDRVIEFSVSFLGKNEPVVVSKANGVGGGLQIYLVENQRYFGGKDVYGERDLERFLFFSRSVFELLPRLEWQPEIVHCHDWHTALIVMWLEKSRLPYGTVFTIHNLAYQGSFDQAFLSYAGLNGDWEARPIGAPKPPQNYMSQGILWADRVSTVSQTYASEILTPEYGEGLESLLHFRRKDLVGILNGIDYTEYNPETDPNIISNFSPRTLTKRSRNKLALQGRTGLPEDANVPLIGVVQRLDEQKGFDIFEKAVSVLLETESLQLVILGSGREHYRQMVERIAARYAGRVFFEAAFDKILEHQIYAGSDMFLVPSRFEPCGLGQMIAMRYGSIPIVRHTGGLIDTVPEFNSDLTRGNGFVFQEYTSEALQETVARALLTYRIKKDAWGKAVQRVMALDFSWDSSARRYESLYREVLEVRAHAG